MQDLRQETIKTKLLSGTLRRDKLQRVWGGKGNGRPCAGCNNPIKDSDIEIEAKFGDQQILCFHSPCFDRWCTETQGWAR
jgi:hypothetical protein